MLNIKPCILGRAGILIALILIGLIGLASWPPTTQAENNNLSTWNFTGLTLPGDQAHYCFDGTRPDILYVSLEKDTGAMRQGSYIYNLATGQKTRFSDLIFSYCLPNNGLLVNTSKLFNSDNPTGYNITTYTLPRAGAQTYDGSTQLYVVDYSNPASSRLFYSPDNGRSWEERGQQFKGHIYNESVSTIDANSLYVLTREDHSDHSAVYTIYFSSDAGLSWQSRYQRSFAPGPNGTVPYILLENAVQPSRATPVNMVWLLEDDLDGSDKTHYLTSVDGGRSFYSSEFEDSPSTLSVFSTPTGLVRFGLNGATYEGAKYELDRSGDGGQSWAGLDLPLKTAFYDSQLGLVVPGVYQAANQPANLFAAYDKGVGDIWYSADSGGSWRKLAANLPTVLATPYAPLGLVGIDANNRIYTLKLPQADSTVTAPTSASNVPGGVFYSETGHNLAGIFKAYWEQHGALAQFGYPRTEPYLEVNPSDGRVYLVQYFERNRFEYHPQYRNTPYEVLLGLLGNQLTADRRAKGEGAFNTFEDAHYPGGTYFSETGHNLRNSFKTYWEQHGGLAIYGYPISEEFEEVNPDDGHTYVVQYFERNRFEYHPENKGTQYEVLLGLLGNTLLKQKGWL